MGINTTLESASTTAASNGPSGSDQRTVADDALRQYLAFIKSLKTLATLASNTTVTPPSTANAFSVTGTTAITTIASTNSWDGRDILFVFAGILTFTHGSNLILPGSANITTAVGDAAWLVQVASGQWRCVGYSRADGSWAYGNITASAFIPSGSTVPTNGLYLKAANNPAISSNTALRWDVSSAGNHTFAASAGGQTISASGTTGLVGIQYTSGGVTQAVGYETSANAYSGAISNHPYNLITNNVLRVAIAAAGNVVVNAPSSGVALTVTPVSLSKAILATAALAGQAVDIGIANTSNTASADARLIVSSGGASAGDPIVIFDVSGQTDWTIGIDNAGGLGNDCFTISGNSTAVGTNDRMSITVAGQVFLQSIHNNASGAAGTTPMVASGTFVPTLTGGVNVASTSSGSMNWIRVGNIVHFAGILTVDPTIASADTQVGISLPIASNLQTGANLSGTAVRDHQGGAGVYVTGVLTGDTTNDRANLRFVCDTNASVFIWYYTGNYEVL